MKKEKHLAMQILRCIGGKENLKNIENCMTRLRIELKQEDLADIPALKEVSGILGVIKNGSLQIIVGPGTVNKVTAVIRQIADVKNGNKSSPFSFHKFLRKIAHIFIPLLPGLVASGIIHGTANFAKNAGANPDASWMQILLLLGSGIFTYLGILVGWNTAKEFGGTPVLGAIAGMFLFNPMLAGITIYGEALVPGRGGLFGVLFAAWLMTVVEKQVRKGIPDSLDILLTPFITILVVGIVSLYVIQPAAGLISDGVTQGLTAVLDIGGALAGALLAGLFLPLVMAGLHHGLTPIHLELISVHGSTSLLPILAMAGAGQLGAAIAIYVKTKNKRLRHIIKGALPVGFLGIGEPLLYGVTLPLGRPFITASCGAAVGGAFQAALKTASSGIGISGISLTPIIVDNKYVLYILGLLLSYTFGFLFTYFFGFREEMANHIS